MREKKDINIEIGGNIQVAREQAGYTQDTLSEMLGMTPNHLSAIERVRLTEFHKQFQAVGNNYNQVVRALKNNFGEKRARALLYKLERLSLELMLVCKKVMALTQEYERKWLQK